MSLADRATTISTNNTIIAENMQKVYDAGVAAKEKWWWDVITRSGARTDYAYAFRRDKFEVFHPPYVIKPQGTAQSMFFVTTLPHLEAGYVDFSASTDLSYAFFTSNIPIIDEIDATSNTNYAYMFDSAKTETIGKFILGTTQKGFGTCFSALPTLKNIAFENEILVSINFQSAGSLTAKSITNIVNALSSEVSEQTLTLKLAAVQTAFETTEGAADGNTAGEWLNLAATKSNWTITLV